MAFIPRPNLPEGLVAQLMQLRAAQADPFVTALQGVGEWADTFMKARQTRAEEQRADQRKRQGSFDEAQTKLLLEGRLGPVIQAQVGGAGPGAIPTGPTTADLARMLNIGGPVQARSILPSQEAAKMVMVDDNLIKNLGKDMADVGIDLAPLKGKQIPPASLLSLQKTAAAIKASFKRQNDKKAPGESEDFKLFRMVQTELRADPNYQIAIMQGDNDEAVRIARERMDIKKASLTTQEKPLAKKTEELAAPDYKTPDEVRAAFKAKKLTREQARALIQKLGGVK